MKGCAHVGSIKTEIFVYKIDGKSLKAIDHDTCGNIAKSVLFMGSNLTACNCKNHLVPIERNSIFRQLSNF